MPTSQKNWTLLPFLLLILSSSNLWSERIAPALVHHSKIKSENPHGVFQQEDTLNIHYVFDTLKKNGNTYFRNSTDENKKLILSLNRISENKLATGSILVIPDTIISDMLVYAPFPLIIDSLTNVSKCILISQRVQAFGIYENGVLVKWGPVSTGKKSTPTPNGLFYTNWKSRLKISSIDSNWIMPWYFNIDNLRGIALHEYDLPGFPASHGCIRLLADDAIWIYNWADEWIRERKSVRILQNGTPVIIYGNYDFKNKPPWRNLPANQNSNQMTQEELALIVTIYASSLKH